MSRTTQPQLNALYEQEIEELNLKLLEQKIQIKMLNKQIKMINNTIKMNELY